MKTITIINDINAHIVLTTGRAKGTALPSHPIHTACVEARDTLVEQNTLANLNQTATKAIVKCQSVGENVTPIEAFSQPKLFVFGVNILSWTRDYFRVVWWRWSKLTALPRKKTNR